jgi:DNA-binding beta-propeller fold protein YncE
MMSFLTTILGLKRQTCFQYRRCLFKVVKILQCFLGRWINFSPLRLASFLLGWLLAAVVGLSSVYAQNTSQLHLEKEIPLSGVEGRIDHFSADVLGQRLFVAALQNGTVEVLDIRKGERSAEIKGLSEPQGVYYSSQNGELYVASGGDGTLRIYDGNSLKLRQTVEFGEDADNVRYDARSGQILVGFGSGGLGLVDASGQRIGTIPLSSHPESFQLEEGDSRIFVNVPKEFAVAVVDRTKHTVIAKWGLDRTFANYPMALDEEDKRLFVGCRVPARLVVLNTDSGQVVAKIPVVGDTDDVYFDPTRRFVYVIGGEGSVDVFRMSDPNHYEYAGRTNTASGARTGLFIPGLDRIFVAVPHRGSQAAKVLVYQITQFPR